MNPLVIRGVILCLLYCVALLLPLPVWAGPALNTPITGWSDGFSTWTHTAVTASTISEGTSVTMGSYLRVSFAEDPPPPGTQVDTIRSASAADNYSTGTAILFNFMAEDVSPISAVLRLRTSDGSIWDYDFGSSIAAPLPGADQWQSFVIPLYHDYGAQWAGGSFDTSAEFEADLASVEWIGIEIQRFGTAQEDYGIDLFQISSNPVYEQGGGGGSGVPEPGEIVMIATALLSFGALWRWRTSAAHAIAPPGDPAGLA